MFPFFGYSQTSVPAHLIHHFFHCCQIFGCSVQLVTVIVTDGVGYHVKMEMITILVNSHQNLVTRKFLFCELLTKGQHFFRGYFFIFMERQNVVRTHPAGILIPNFFFFSERPIDGIPVQSIWSRASHIQVALFHFVAAKDVFDGVPQSTVGLW